MKSKYYIIDAFNLMLADPKADREINKEGGRAIVRNSQSLLETIEAFAGGSELSVVFDGENPGIGIKAENLDILFSGRYIDADTVIKKLIDTHDFKGHITVVTSDRRIISYALQSGAQYISSQDFRLFLEMGGSLGNEEIADEEEDETGAAPTASHTTPERQNTKSSPAKKQPDRRHETFYGSFKEGLSEEEMGDILSDYSPKKSAYNQTTHGKSAADKQIEESKKQAESSDAKSGDESDGSKDKESLKHAKAKAKEKAKKLKKVSLEDLNKALKK